ncbi:hypothetical protein N658DRAFT_344355 [Parathielavia hyrcaniae]|uniref:Uncharacterized protein n=1 Tax=Parathielavia hyrcaniae TaxID=113614 RepID=A0AAN6Q344_9PEZI|nr:hypothetical protein N658DRAFT_344355 [Parathielavia hyrcaniae]
MLCCRFPAGVARPGGADGPARSVGCRHDGRPCPTLRDCKITSEIRHADWSSGLWRACLVCWREQLGQGDSTEFRAPRSSRRFACPKEQCSLAMRGPHQER